MKVNTDELLRQAEQFRSVINAMTEVGETIEHIAASLDRESGTRRFRPALMSVARQVTEQSRDVAMLQRALNQIAECYGTTETRITDRATGDAVRHSWQITRMHDMKELTRALWVESADAPQGPGMLEWIPWDPE